ncbi:hypothetical protein [Methanothermobacter sp.]|uniref:hypothetical protein n=1 Tax=Methanothermobacter sp. TaxID=1884223 RepID=UPI003C74219E
MDLIKIVSCLEDGNIIHCGGNIRDTYHELSERAEELNLQAAMVYLVSPMPLKAGLLEIMRAHEPGAQEKLTITEIMTAIASIERETWVFMDHFEDLTGKAAGKYLWLHTNGRVNYMAGLTGTFRGEVQSFYSTFRKLNPSRCLDGDSIDVSVTVMALISVFASLCYLRVGLEYGLLATSAIWFALIVFRTINYIVR